MCVHACMCCGIIIIENENVENARASMLLILASIQRKITHFQLEFWETANLTMKLYKQINGHKGLQKKKLRNPREPGKVHLVSKEMEL